MTQGKRRSPKTTTVSHLLAIAFLFLATIGGATDTDTDCGDDPPFRITTKRDSDKVEVTVEKDKAAISVRSPFGISQAIIERSDNDSAERRLLRDAVAQSLV